MGSLKKHTEMLNKQSRDARLGAFRKNMMELSDRKMAVGSQKLIEGALMKLGRMADASSSANVTPYILGSGVDPPFSLTRFKQLDDEALAELAKQSLHLNASSSTFTNLQQQSATSTPKSMCCRIYMISQKLNS